MPRLLPAPLQHSTHPQPPSLCLLLQPPLLHELERSAGAALQALQGAVAQAGIEEPAGERRRQWGSRVSSRDGGKAEHSVVSTVFA